MWEKSSFFWPLLYKKLCIILLDFEKKFAFPKWWKSLAILCYETLSEIPDTDIHIFLCQNFSSALNSIIQHYSWANWKTKHEIALHWFTPIGNVLRFKLRNYYFREAISIYGKPVINKNVCSQESNFRNWLRLLRIFKIM